MKEEVNNKLIEFQRLEIQQLKINLTTLVFEKAELEKELEYFKSQKN
jgi:hypothetical protein